MFDFIGNEFGKGCIILGVFFAVMIRLAAKNPQASGGIARGLLSMFFRR